MMHTVMLHIKKMPGCDDIPLPRYMTPHAAGMDICAAVTKEVVLQPGSRALIPTGICIALPPGYEAQIRPRSGLAVKHGIGLLNAPGTIDADYRGEIKLIVINLGDEPFTIHRNDRIAQMVIHQVAVAEVVLTEDLPPTMRNQGGFGHTGR
jgi:dUTP pyrophosphatase